VFDLPAGFTWSNADTAQLNFAYNCFNSVLDRSGGATCEMSFLILGTWSLNSVNPVSFK
jgi:hypothetical protein